MTVIATSKKGDERKKKCGKITAHRTGIINKLHMLSAMALIALARSQMPMPNPFACRKNFGSEFLSPHEDKAATRYIHIDDWMKRERVSEKKKTVCHFLAGIKKIEDKEKK